MRKICLSTGAGASIGALMGWFVWSPVLQRAMPTMVQELLYIINMPAVLLFGDLLKLMRVPFAERGDGFFVYVYAIVLMWTLMGLVIGILLSCPVPQEPKQHKK